MAHIHVCTGSHRGPVVTEGPVDHAEHALDFPMFARFECGCKGYAGLL
jgi:hypothetical protein